MDIRSYVPRTGSSHEPNGGLREVLLRHFANLRNVREVNGDQRANESFRVAATISLKGGTVARKTIRVSDKSGQEIPEGKGAVVRITFADARKGVRELDLTDTEAEALGGRPVARRGRRPRVQASS